MSYRRFPAALLPLVRCFHGGGTLAAAGDVEDGSARCSCCGRDYPIAQGILSLLDAKALDGESANEMRVRDQDGGFDARHGARGGMDEAERVPTLQQLAPLEGATVLDLGCGTGRYTLPLLEKCKALIGADFSRGLLRALAAKLADDPRVGLVQADVTRFAVAPGAFDRILSTLVSNLPTGAHREAMYKLAARALAPEGRFVFSTHNYGLRERLKREPVEGPYNREYPVYRRLFTPDEILRESAPHFRRVQFRPAQIVPPLTRYTPRFPFVQFSAFAEHVPLLNRLASILVFTAQA